MNGINVSRLRIDLYGSDKIPKDAEGVYNDFTCFDQFGEIIGRFTVTIIKQSRPSQGRFHTSAHRVFVDCPSCKKMVPAGRLHQHIGTGTCQ